MWFRKNRCQVPSRFRCEQQRAVNMARVFVTGSFDDLRSRDVRFLEEASNLGELNVLLWSDQAVRSATGAEPKFPQQERLYFLRAIRYVHDVKLTEEALPSPTDA